MEVHDNESGAHRIEPERKESGIFTTQPSEERKLKKI
jgi:hypothetical protein